MNNFISCEECAGNKLKANCYRCIHNDNTMDYFIPKVNKIIDLSMMVGSNIDMEFRSGSLWRIGNLEKINTLQGHYYKYKEAIPYTKCRIRQGHWHHFLGNVCPLPEGLEISYRIIFKGTPLLEEHSTRDYQSLNWNHITAFKIICSTDGWKYGWEK